MNIGPLLIRPGVACDLAAITSICAHAVGHTLGSFEIDAPDSDEMAGRRDEVLEQDWPWLVATCDEQVLGCAYAKQFRARSACRHTVEDSVCLHPKAQGQVLARPLLAELLARCVARGARQALAVIGDSDNRASIALHRSLGFENTGTLKSVGRKFDRWVDIVLMQRSLGGKTDAAARA